MDSVVEIVKCKACGASIPAAANVRALRCPQCGTLAIEESARSKSPLAESVVSSSEDAWFRDLLAKIYCRSLIVLILYVLSTGPMYWLVYEAFRANGSVFLAKLYLPIVFACQYSDVICGWFDWYVGLWVY